MSLPAAWVDRVFEKLTLVYGRDFIGRWEGTDLNAVKSDWGHELDGFEKFPKSIAWALQNLPPEKAPTVLQFRAIARRAPEEQAPRIEPSVAGKERIAAELAKLGPILAKTAPSGDSLYWARRLIQRHECGAYKATRTSLAMARDALGLDKPGAQA